MLKNPYFSILLVDDNPKNLFSLRSLIEAHIDADVHEASSGIDALQLLLQERIDLIILDVQMPQMDGFETAELIRRRQKTQNIPILFLTAAYKAEEFRRRGFEIGAADYLTKPIDDFQLISRIKSYARFIYQERLHHQELEQKIQQRTTELLQANTRLQQEILERQRIQEELLEFKQKMLEILASITDALLVVDSAWKLTYLNPQAKKLLQIQEEAIGESIWILFPFLKEMALFNQLHMALETQSAVECTEFHSEWQNWLYVRAYPYQKGLSIYIQDVTSSKRIESLQKTDLLNRAKTEFLANMNHELRTPLNSILGYTQILERDSNLTHTQKQRLDIIHRSSNHLLTLIDDILDLSKLENQLVKLNCKPFSLKDFLEKEIVDLFTLRAAQKSLSFIYELSTELPEFVNGDKRRLRQILVHLLGNAFKFTHKGGVTFRVKLNGEGLLRFQIEDTGVGLSQEQLQNLFVSFQQAGQSTTILNQGIGLGLPISKHLIELMSGKLQVKSTLAQGSTFWFEIDLPKHQALLRTDNEDTRVVCGFRGNSCLVLVVDDSLENRAILNHFLTPLGFTIIEAENGSEGLEKAFTHRPDVILTDLVMPSLDGFELVRRIRQSPELKHVTTIAISASVLNSDLPDNLPAGCDAFIPKPISMKKLLKVLGETLQLEWIYQEKQPPPQPSSPQPATLEKKTFSIGPSQEIAQAIFELAMMGDIKGIQEQADDLEQTDSNLAPFASEIRRLAKNYQDDKICELVQQYL